MPPTRSGAPRATDAKYLGGGTNLVDLMRENVERPLGAGRRDRPVGRDRGDRRRRPDDRRGRAQHRGRRAPGGPHALPDAHARDRRRRLGRRSATWRRSAATCCSAPAAPTSMTPTGRAATSASPGEGCDAIEGFNRNHAILGASPACVATHPSDMCVALAALDAVVHLRSASGERTVALCDLHRLPEDRPDIETVLEPGELITAVQLPRVRSRRAFDLPQGARPRRATRSRSSRSPPRWSSTATRSPTCASRWAGSPPSRGGRGAPRRRCEAGRRRRPAFLRGGRRRAGRRPPARRQRVQGRPDPPHDRRRPASS